MVTAAVVGPFVMTGSMVMRSCASGAGARVNNVTLTSASATIASRVMV